MPLVQYWHKEKVPDEIERHFVSARERNPSMRHLVFNEETAADFIAMHFSTREVAAFRACGPPAMQADYLRYCAIYALGGVYCDADVRCVAAFSPLLDSEGTLLEFIDGTGIITNQLFGFRRPGHPLLGLSIEMATMGIERRFEGEVGMVTGPWIFTALAMIWRLGFDEFIALARSWLAHQDEHEKALLHLQTICTLLGDYRRVEKLFDEVRVLVPGETVFIKPGTEPLPYRETKDHYLNWQGSIYT